MTTSTIDRPAAGPPPPTTRLRPLWLVGALAAIVAAVATVAVALGAKAIDISLDVDGDEIPVPGFAFGTLLGSAVGTGLAIALARWAKRPARTFAVITVVLTVLSLIPVVTADADTATQVALVLSHVVAAAIVIPALTRRLSTRESGA